MMEAIKLHRIGTDRICAPEETLERLEAKGLRQRCGITRVANLTGLDVVGVPVVSVCRPNSRSIVVAQGKGATLAAAKASGIMEAIEAYHAETARLPLLLSNSLELAGAPLADLERLPKSSVKHFRADTRILWTEADDIAQHQKALVPYELVHTDYTVPLPSGSGCFLMSSNGLASGNHFLEAVSHGICELVERDAVTLHAHQREAERDARRVDLGSIDDDLCCQVLERFAAADVACQVSDVTSDVGIPAFRCNVADRAGGAVGYAMPVLRGTGCHPRREIALLRALTEAAQTRVTMISGARDDLSPWWYSDKDRVAAARRAFFNEQGLPAERSFMASSTHDAQTLEADVSWMLERLRTAGFPSVLVVDLTKPEFGISVVRVIIPGLEPMRESQTYTPGARALSLAARGAA